MKRREFLPLLAAPFMASLLPRMGMAQPAGFPAREVNLIVTYSAGGGSDYIARYLADRLQKDWGKPVIVTNVAGAGGRTGTAEAAQADPDGYTYLVGANGPLCIFPHLYKKLPYDPAASFMPVSSLASQPFVIAAAKDFGPSNLTELVEYAKAHPGEVSFGSAGVGTTPHLVLEVLKGRAGIDMLHVPYRGSPQALQDLMGGVIQLSIGDPNTMMGPVSEGLVKAIVVTSAQRSPLYPDVATVAEAGYEGFDLSGWFGLLAPAGAPTEITDFVSAEVVRVLASDDAQKVLGTLGGIVGGSTPADFGTAIKRESDRWAAAITEYNLTQFAT